MTNQHLTISYVSMECTALKARRIYGITSLVIIYAYDLFNFVSPSIQAINYFEISGESVASNSFLVRDAPTRKVQDYKIMEQNGAVSWVSCIISTSSVC